MRTSAIQDESDDDEYWNCSQVYPTMVEDTKQTMIKAIPTQTVIRDAKKQTQKRKKQQNEITKNSKSKKKTNTITTTTTNATTTTTNATTTTTNATTTTTNATVAQVPNAVVPSVPSSSAVANRSICNSSFFAPNLKKQQKLSDNDVFNELAKLNNNVSALVASATKQQELSMPTFLQNVDLFDVLLYYDELSQLCRRSLSNFKVYFCPGFLDYVSFSHCICSQKKVTMFSLREFMNEKDLYQKNDALQSVYVVAWKTKTCCDTPTVLTLNTIFSKNKQIARNVLYFSLCVAKKLVS